MKLVYTLRRKDHPKLFHKEEKMGIIASAKKKRQLGTKSAAAMQLVRSFHNFSHLHRKICKNASLMELLQDELLVQTMRQQTDQRKNVSSTTIVFS
jgi:hypothetical protein